MKQAEHIRFLFKEKNMLLKDVAKEMGLSTTGLSLKVAGTRRFTQKDISFLLKKLNMSFEDVFIDDDTEIIQIGKTRYIVPVETVNKVLTIVKNFEVRTNKKHENRKDEKVYGQ